MVREPEVRLADVLRPGVPFVGQVEGWAQSQGARLPDHWKVALSVRFKQRALMRGIAFFEEAVVARWVQLFEGFSR
jgi:hypothetical protein